MYIEENEFFNALDDLDSDDLGDFVDRKGNVLSHTIQIPVVLDWIHTNAADDWKSCKFSWTVC